MALDRAGSNYFILSSDSKRSLGGGAYLRQESSFRDRLELLDVLGDNPNDPSASHRGVNESGSEPFGVFDDEFSIDFCCDILKAKFGFQEGSVDNQREHALLLLANCKAQNRSADVANHIAVLHRKLVGNYVEWCNFLQVDPVWYAGPVNDRFKNRMHMEIMLYLCIWGEAGNIRHMPECICYLYHQMMGLLNGDLNFSFLNPPNWYLESVIRPIWTECAGMQKKDALGKHFEHTKVRNYDDLNEFFWKPACLAVPVDRAGETLKSHGKTYYEHRSIFTLVLNYYRIFHFNFMFLFALAVLQYCVTISPKGAESGFSQFAALGQTVTPYTSRDLKLALVFLVLMQALLSALKCLLEAGHGWHLLFSPTPASSRSLTYGVALALRLLWNGAFAGLFLYMMVEGTGTGATPVLDQLLVLALAFVGPSVLLMIATLLLPTPALTNSFWAKFIREGDSCYTGRNMSPPWSYRSVYTAYWLVLWTLKAAVSYWILITPLMLPSLAIYNMPLQYTTDVVSMRNFGVIAALWAPVFFIFCYDTQIYFTIFQALYGAYKGVRMHTGEYHGFAEISKAFRLLPQLFDTKVVTKDAVQLDNVPTADGHRKSMLMARFVVVWNEVINFFREGDLLDDKEAAIFQYDVAPISGEIYEPVFLSAGKLDDAISTVLKLAAKKGGQGADGELTVELLLRDCLPSIKSAFNAVYFVLDILLDESDVRVFEGLAEIERIAADGRFMATFQVAHLLHVREALTAFLEAVLDLPPPAAPLGHSSKGHPMPLIQEFVHRFEALMQACEMLCRGKPDLAAKFTHSNFAAPRNGHVLAAEGMVRLCEDDVALANATRALLLLTLDPADAMPRCSEAKRRLGFFMKSLLMDIPQLASVREMKSFSVMTPFYAEGVLYSIKELQDPLENHAIFAEAEEAGKNLTILKYLITIHTAEWENFIERIGVATEEEAIAKHPLELRLWASYRGQTLARTVQGMMLYEDAIKMLYWLEIGSSPTKTGEMKQRMLEDMVILKFSYVCACQVYGKHRDEKKAQAADIDFLLRRYPNLRVAYVDTVKKDGAATFYSVLIKAEGDKIAEVYRYELPGDPILGEGKPENQNNALPFTRGEYLQTIDMNQQHYFEECLKMPNLLVTADLHPSGKPVSIIGMREHIFTGNASSLSKFKSWQELVFVTLSQRVLADPLYVRMHYGHPDIFDKVMCLTRGGVSKASKGINLSEDVFAGFNATLRGGVVTHVEFMQCGKGRDVALSQISMFEGKLANGAGETCLAREAHRMGAFLDFCRLNSMYYSHTGFYFATWLTIVTAFVFIYCKVYLALTGVQAQIVYGMNSTDIIKLNSDKGFDTRAFNNLDNVINTQYYIQAGLFLTLPLMAVYFTEAGLRRGFLRFFNMMATAGWAFFTFQVGTTMHYFDMNIIHGNAKYQATGRGFKITRETFVLLYKAYSASHYRKAMEFIGLTLIYGVYGVFDICQKTPQSATNTFSQKFCATGQGYGTQTFAIWFIAVLWLVSPFLFNTDGFDYEKTKADIKAWAAWLFMAEADVDAKDKVNNGGWIGWWKDDEKQFHGTKPIARATVVLREARHWLLVWYVVTLRHSVAYLAVVVGAVLVTLAIMQLGATGGGLRASAHVRAVVYGLLVAVPALLYFLATLVYPWSMSWADSLSLFFGYMAALYGVNETARVFAFPSYSIANVGVFMQLAFFWDFVFGAVMLVPLVVLSVIPFMNIIQTRMMYNEGFSQVLSDSSQYAFSIAGVIGFIGAGACGWLYYVLTTLASSAGFLSYTSAFNIVLSNGNNVTAYFVLVGCVVGAVLSGVLGFYLGRRFTIVAGGVASFVAMCLLTAVASYSSSGTELLLGGLSLFGIALGVLLPTIAGYCYEISTKEMRARIMLLLAVGFVTGNLAASYFSYGTSLVWLWQAFWCFLVFALLTPAINLLPESPEWELARNGEEACKQCLVLLRRRQDVAAELQALQEKQVHQYSVGNGVLKAVMGALFIAVLSLSTLPLYMYTARLFTANGRPLMLTNCLATELLFAALSFLYIEKFTHKLLLLLTLPLVAVGAGILGAHDKYQIFGSNDATAMQVLLIVLYAVKGAGLPATLWVSAIGLFRTRGRFITAPMYFATFFGLQVFATYLRVDTQAIRSPNSKECIWIFALAGLSAAAAIGTSFLARRSNGLVCTAAEMAFEAKQREIVPVRSGSSRHRGFSRQTSKRVTANRTMSPRKSTPYLHAESFDFPEPAKNVA
ncbi:glycosyltransferase [Achlya hypogyna]|uniref:1,3-beta-glucan synthase n=1 Tax=Achlya hypogyna TaxID=1202772 RepID=A0A1V9ZU00_ACHHY|nr:glycosyltransferase [Achlya hypogyna]